jgi:hypothetical protein
MVQRLDSSFLNAEEGRSVILPYKYKPYYGFDDGNSAAVFVSSAGQKMAPLPLRLDIINHSPTGFEWGYSWSGPAQLAVAILADWTGCDYPALALYQRFKAAAIAGLPEKHWSLTDNDLVRIFETMCKKRPWLDRLAVLEDGPTVQIVDPYAEHPGEFATVVAIVPHDSSEANDEVVVSFQKDGSQLSLYRDRVSVAMLLGTRG